LPESPRPAAPKLSIALATYNGGRYLKEQLDSFAAQTVLPYEVVVGDDGSTDDTLAVLEEFARTAPFLMRIQRNPRNYGYSRNFCEIVERCEGDIIFLSDQDDYWLPDKLQRCADALQVPGALLVTHDARLADGALNPADATMFGQLRAMGASDPDALNYGCCMAFDRFLAGFVAVPPYDYHDMWLAVVARLMGGRVFIDEPLILYRRHGGNASHSHLTRLRRTGPVQAFLNRLRRAHRVGAGTAVNNALGWATNMLAAFQQNRDGVIARVGDDRYAAIIADMEAQCRNLSSRYRVLDGPGLTRPWRVARFALSGGYGRDATRWSALRDLFG
jgi:glycosyltransferase involved in cell wall biosynthesis